jgi:hypothetical protein
MAIASPTLSSASRSLFTTRPKPGNKCTCRSRCTCRGRCGGRGGSGVSVPMAVGGRRLGGTRPLRGSVGGLSSSAMHYPSCEHHVALTPELSCSRAIIMSASERSESARLLNVGCQLQRNVRHRARHAQRSHWLARTEAGAPRSARRRCDTRIRFPRAEDAQLAPERAGR